MTAPNPEVDAFISHAARWQGEMTELRRVLLACDLGEELKWGKPCYTVGDGNVVIMQPFKAHLSLMFFKGALLEDPEDVLRSQGENTQAAMRIEFTSPEQVVDLEPIIKAYIEEAVAIEEAGLAVPRTPVREHDMPAELENRFRSDAAYRNAFRALTPGRKRSYLMRFSRAKRTETRERRIEACRAKVLEGKGFNER